MNNLENLNLIELNKTELQNIEGGKLKWWQWLLIGVAVGFGLEALETHTQ
ncbi:MAG: bacteriocin [Ekhidna sp.]|nr:bacteriocin [Ekhidna sp.]